jgi:hypothetical protein
LDGQLFRGPPLVAAIHWVLGVLLVFNIYFNYAKCVFTSPGNTLSVENEVAPSSREPPQNNHKNILDIQRETNSQR